MSPDREAGLCPKPRPAGTHPAEGGPVTERALRDLRAAQAVEHQHLGSDTVGEHVFLDTMYVGNLKGVGKIWQYTGVDGACSFGFARVKGRQQERRDDGALPRTRHRPGLPGGRHPACRGHHRRRPRVHRTHYYEHVHHIDDDLQAWLRHYNFERPHRAYRTRGRIPAAIFYATRQTYSPRKDGTSMTSTQQPELSELILSRKA